MFEEYINQVQKERNRESEETPAPTTRIQAKPVEINARPNVEIPKL